MPSTLNYGRAPETGTGPAGFWIVYIICCFFGLEVLGAMLDQLLWGHPGDQVVGKFNLTSVGLVTGVVGVAYWVFLRRLRRVYGLLIAAASGLAAFLPAYALLYLFF